ncbi:MAG TPA: hypothetical protein VNN73_04325 [Blastocatellia bacterium]|nr:hypothetical protein [Blastocatellia bacterium]
MRRRIKLLLPLIALLAPASAMAQAMPQISQVDRIRLAEAFRIAEKLGDKVWKGWSKAPFAIVLVTAEHEFLIRHPKPPKDFTPLKLDALLRSEVYFRKRVFQPSLLATLFLEGVPTIVIGQAENTDAKTSTRWVVTLLHEHFHQLQYSQPDYAAATNALNLSHGDQTGMWMLNFPFPYAAPEVNKNFSALCRALADALQRKNKLAAYIEARRQFKESLSEDDYKYFSFQLWQEGFARYTEYRIAGLAASQYRPSAQFRSLKDFTPFRDACERIIQLPKLLDLSLEKDQRVAFYLVGAAEAILLDDINPKWQQQYFANKFFTERYFLIASYKGDLSLWQLLFPWRLFEN